MHFGGPPVISHCIHLPDFNLVRSNISTSYLGETHLHYGGPSVTVVASTYLISVL